MSNAQPQFAGSTRTATSIRPRAAVLLVGLTIAGLALLQAASAGAAQFHPFKFSFNGAGTTAGQFSDIEDVAIHQQTGTVYVLDRANGVIDRFDSAGNPQDFPATGTSSLNVSATCSGFNFSGDDGLGVDSSGGPNDGKLYVAAYGGSGVCAYDSTGALLWHLQTSDVGGACGVATDPAGRLWVGVYGSGGLQYTASGSPPTLVTIIALPPFEWACRLAVGSAGNVYLAKYFGQGVERWTVVGFQQQISSGGRAVTVDPATDHVYIAKSDRIDEYTPNAVHISETGVGPPFDQTGIGTLGNAVGVAVRGSTGEVYVADRSSNQINVYGPYGDFPDVTTGDAENVKRGSASTSGQVAPGGGDVTSCKIEFGTDTLYGQTVDCDQATPFSEAKAVTASLVGLNPGTTYHYRVVAANAVGANYGADRVFTTPFVDGVHTGAAAAITRTAASLNGSLEPNGLGTHYYFEWGTDTSYGNSTPVPPGTDAGSGAGSTPASANIAGLQQETTYHYRLVASNSEGTSYGEDNQFTTLSAVIGLENAPATDVTQTSATLNAKLDPDGLPTHYYFEWGEDTGYGNTTSVPPGATTGPAPGTTPVSASLSGLQSYSTYHYRLIASNSLGTTVGPDQTLTTLPPLLPAVSNTSSTEVRSTAATLMADINPGFGDTIYRFQYGTDTAYGFRTNTSNSIGSDNGDHPVSVQLSQLRPGTTYHFQAVAINFSGVTHGSDQTFTTPNVPTIESIDISEISQTGARVGVQINPGLSPTTFHVEYGTSRSYGSNTAESATGGGMSTVVLSGLSPGTTYHLRVVAANLVGTTNGVDRNFVTSPAQGPPGGNQRRSPCRKGFVRRHGKCVKKRHRRHRKSHKKAHDPRRHSARAGS